VSTTLWMSPEQHMALREIKCRTGKPLSVLYREGIDYIAQRYAPEVDNEEPADRALAAAKLVRSTAGEPHPKLTELAEHIERLHHERSKAVCALHQATSALSRVRADLRDLGERAQNAALNTLNGG